MVPVSFLRKRIQDSEEAFQTHQCKVQRELEDALLVNATIAERMMKLQRALMNCALGPEPAVAAM